MNKIIIPIIVVVISFSLIAILTVSNPDQDPESKITEEIEVNPSQILNPEPTPESEPEPVSIPMPPQTGLGFSVNVTGEMHDRGYFTISGNIPDEPNHLTGIIFAGAGDDLKIVYAFQQQLDDDVNHFQEKVRINGNYLWDEDTTYIVSVNHGGVIKEIEFYRGTTVNNFEDSIVPII